MGNSRIYLSPPHVAGNEEAYVLDAIRSNWVAPLGPHVDGFELELGARAGGVQVAALSSGTAALHLALILIGVQRGDRVFVSDLTFSAPVNAIRYVGAEPVLIDCDSDTWNVDPSLLEEELARSARAGNLPRAFVGVDLYGQCADWDRIRKACAEYGVPCIEDAAEALGATYRDRAAGGLADIGVFSFNGNKIITTSGGGALLSSQASWVARARYLATQAREPAPHYEHVEVGYNYRMSNLLAAVGRAQLESLDARVARRRAIFAYYSALLSGFEGVSFMPEASYGRCTRWLSCLTLDPRVIKVSPEQVRVALEAQNIETRPVWKPMHLQPVFRDAEVIERGVAARLFATGLCLPSGSSLEDSDLERVGEALKRAISGDR
ncbi:MAG: aminotransferase class I/II-fold pyridoxal phosphate-dependent enzyme [Polyangiaceae bacterium]|nr:aminotransferase class I/II-fold pyridoxal phosphate-dependent enzyme [Polyangiaceae bacterium]